MLEIGGEGWHWYLRIWAQVRSLEMEHIYPDSREWKAAAQEVRLGE